MNRWLLCLLLVATGCAPREYFRTEVSDSPCLPGSAADCSAANLILDPKDDYTLGFVEFDDHGHFFDERQAESVIDLLSDGDSDQPVYVAIYAHGWHHNAHHKDSNVERFKGGLRQLKRRNPQYRVIGIYLGWRGEILELPWLRTLTFWSRKAVSENLGRTQLQDFLLRIETVVKHEGDQANRLLTVGHSLGAMVVFNALQPYLLQRMGQADKEPAGFGDLLVLVNPAFEAKRFTAIRAAARRFSEQHLGSAQANPRIVIATSEADSITKTAFTWSRALPALFETAPAGLPGMSSWELNATAVGHYRGFITHRLEANSQTAAECASAHNSRDALSPEAKNWSISNGLTIYSQGKAPNLEPVWVVQTDKNVLPNHGFMAESPLWCFIERMVWAGANVSNPTKKPSSPAS